MGLALARSSDIRACILANPYMTGILPVQGVINAGMSGFSKKNMKSGGTAYTNC